ncbi:MAG: metal ABC transporter permease, partial [Calditrichaeota bacterium]|nr:metal ABC transporter permease [Calditrichota bacterium]
MGSVFGKTIGFEDHSWELYVSSLGFAMLAAFLFSLIKSDHSKIPVEAMIGTGYAFSSALTILMIVKTPESAEQIKEMLVGSILLVSPKVIIKTAIFYTIIGIIHFVFRKQIYARSNHQKIDKAVLWDFIFYGTFSVVVTSSVSIAGVLLVFSFLVVPAIVSIMLGDSIKKQLIIGWSFGLIAST